MSSRTVVLFLIYLALACPAAAETAQGRHMDGMGHARGRGHTMGQGASHGPMEMHRSRLAGSLRATIERFAAYGERTTGSPGCERAAEVIESRFRQLGIKDVSRQDYLIPRRIHEQSAIEINGRTHPLNPLLSNAVSPQTLPPGGVTGPLVYAGHGALHEMNGLSIDGSVVLMDMISGKHFLNAAMLGAKALILVDSGQSPKGFFDDKKELTPIHMPLFFVTAQEAQRLFPNYQSAKNHVVAESVTVTTSMHWKRIQGSNVYGLIEGADPELSEQLVILEAFYDSSEFIPGRSPGAEEAASIAALLEIAGTLARHPPRRSVLLLATSGHGQAQAGMRDFIYSVKSKGTRIKELVRREGRRVAKAKTTLRLLSPDMDLLGLPREDAVLVAEALDSRVRDRVDAITTRLMQLRLADDPALEDEIKRLADKRLRLRRITWGTNFGELSAQELDTVKSFIPDAIERQEAILDDAERQRRVLETGGEARSLAAPYEIAASISLYLSSHGSGIGAFSHGFQYDIRPDRNRNPDYNLVDRVLRHAAEDIQSRLGLDLYRDTLRPSRIRPWKTWFLDTPFMGGEVAALANYLGFTFATVDDARPAWGTPYDTPEKVDYRFLADQTALLDGLVGAVVNEPGPIFDSLPRYGLSELEGEAKLMRQGELFAEQPATGTVVQAYQGPAIYYAMADTAGRFRYTGVCDKKNTFHKMVLEGYRFDEQTGEVRWAVDKPFTGKDNYRVKMRRRIMETTLTMFNARQITVFDLLEPRTFNYMTRINLFDARTESDPVRYWYSRIDTRESTAAAFFLPPGTPLKLTLSDSVLNRKLILTGADADSPSQGDGYRPENWTRIQATPYFVAKDMWRLLTPRIDNLEEHGIANERISELEKRGKTYLDEAEQARSEMMYDTFMEKARASWALATRVYNDVENTQKDVLFGVLFYVALFVPFAYCLERIIFASADIHRRIIGFLAILCTTIGVIYLVHPAFQLTYSPLVVILAFFIVGLSVMVSLIIFTRFEKEMQNLQKRSSHGQTGEISRWKAFTAAFVIGVSNLRRRKIRTSLTIVTLMILTFTIMSFTAVKSVRQSGAMRFSEDVPYRGLMMKALGWNSLPRETLFILENTFRQGAVFGPRVWLENEDRTTAVFVPVSHGDNSENARGLVGLSSREPEISDLENTLTGGRWFTANEPEAALLPAGLAERLGIDPRAPGGARVTLWGMDFSVVGCFDGRLFDEHVDLDGEPLTPVTFPSEAMLNMSEAEAEEMATGEQVRSFQSRYQHVDGNLVVVIPAATATSLGGEMKGVAVKAVGDTDVSALAERMVDRFGLTLFVGEPGGTFVYHAADAISYSGVPNLVIPLFIAVLIVLNTMISSVYERKREIAVYTSVGMAPTHVSYLFIAEAVAFAVISAVLGYLLAQSAAALLSGTALWAGMTANYSSLAGVAAMVLVIAVTLISVIYPSKVAADIAIPDVNRSWQMPDDTGDEIVVTLPFLLKYPEQECLGGFLLDYYQAHQDVTHGMFCADDIGCVFACPTAEQLKALSREAREHHEKNNCLNVSARIWLAPFDFGVKQHVQLVFCPSATTPEFLEVQARITREAGEAGMWRRINKSFLNDLRKQLLVWRSLDTEQRRSYEAILRKATGRIAQGASGE